MLLDDDVQQATMTGAAQEPSAVCDSSSLQQLLEPLIRQQRDTVDKLVMLTSHVQVLEQQVRATFIDSRWRNISERDIAILLIAVFLQLFFVWLLKWCRLWCGWSSSRYSCLGSDVIYHFVGFLLPFEQLQQSVSVPWINDNTDGR